MIEKIRVKLDEGARIDPPAHDGDSGYDIYSREMKIIPAGKKRDISHRCTYRDPERVRRVPQEQVGALREA